MDQEVLVNSGQALVRLLDDTETKPRFAMWVHHPETDTWKLWLVPDESVRDKRQFYRIVAETINRNGDILPTMDVSSTEFTDPNNPIVVGMSQFLHMPSLGSAHLSGNTFNGYYLPEGIALRVALQPAESTI